MKYENTTLFLYEDYIERKKEKGHVALILLIKRRRNKCEIYASQ